MGKISGFLLNAASSVGVNLLPAKLNAFEAYYELLVKTNKKTNLTAITEPMDVCIKHFADSLTIFNCFDFPVHTKVLDIGTGAGFPGLPMLINRPDIKLTMIDSNQKKLDFIEKVLKKINLKAEVLHTRAEDLAFNKDYRVKYDIVVSRAVAALNVLLEYAMPFVAMNGYFVAMKGPSYQEELDLSMNAIKILGGELKKVVNITLPDGSQRNLLLIQRVTGIPAEYPRSNAKIKSNPL